MEFHLTISALKNVDFAAFFGNTYKDGQKKAD